MLEAWHPKLKKGFRAKEASDEFDEPNEETWFCCPNHQIEVTPVKAHLRKVGIDKNGGDKFTMVISHFRVKNSGDSCSSIESDEHKHLKILIASLVENKDITLEIDGLPIKWEDLTFLEIPQLKFRWEQVIGTRRSDVLFNLTYWHNLLGRGINFEVQLSNMTDEEKRKRELDWCKKGYSVAWIYPNMIIDNGLKENIIQIQHPWFFGVFNVFDDYLHSIKKEGHYIKKDAEKILIIRKSISDDIKNIILEETRENIGKSCRTCGNGKPDRTEKGKGELTGKIACWYNWDKFPLKYEPMYYCKNWREPKRWNER